jgi:exodeoxyribonuclease VII small subunit
VKKLKFEDALKKLGDIVDELESGELELEDSIKKFEEGIKLSLLCQQELEKADGKIQRLIKTLDGEIEVLDINI